MDKLSGWGVKGAAAYERARPKSKMEALAKMSECRHLFTR